MLTFRLVPFYVPKWPILGDRAEREKSTIGTYLASRAKANQYVGIFVTRLACLADCLGVLLGCLAVLGEAAWLLLVSCLAAL